MYREHTEVKYYDVERGTVGFIHLVFASGKNKEAKAEKFEQIGSMWQKSFRKKKIRERFKLLAAIKRQNTVFCCVFSKQTCLLQQFYAFIIS